ncbi:hypothetical protein ACWD4F_21705 [Streptomyces aureus]|uniref:hypothetical protein n=1 Tax=Streptomyces aureus TaxID=193461 RepID=UPI00131E0F5C|nr:hypothetical protein [Streptomyces aureus]
MSTSSAGPQATTPASPSPSPSLAGPFTGPRTQPRRAWWIAPLAGVLVAVPVQLGAAFLLLMSPMALDSCSSANPCGHTEAAMGASLVLFLLALLSLGVPWYPAKRKSLGVGIGVSLIPLGLTLASIGTLLTGIGLG